MGNPFPFVLADLRRSRGGVLAVVLLVALAVGLGVAVSAQERALRGRSGLYDVTVRRGDEVVLEFRGRSRSLPPRPS